MSVYFVAFISFWAVPNWKSLSTRGFASKLCTWYKRRVQLWHRRLAYCMSVYLVVIHVVDTSWHCRFQLSIWDLLTQNKHTWLVTLSSTTIGLDLTFSPHTDYVFPSLQVCNMSILLVMTTALSVSICKLIFVANALKYKSVEFEQNLKRGMYHFAHDRNFWA